MRSTYLMRMYSRPGLFRFPYKRNTRIHVWDGIAPVHPPVFNSRDAHKQRSIDSRPVPMYVVLISLCMDTRPSRICAMDAACDGRQKYDFLTSIPAAVHVIIVAHAASLSHLPWYQLSRPAKTVTKVQCRHAPKIIYAHTCTWQRHTVHYT